MERSGTSVVAARGLLLLAAMVGATDLLWRLVRGPLSTVSTMVESHGPGALAGLPFEAALTALFATAVLLSWAWIVLTTTALVAQTVLNASRSDTPTTTTTSAGSTVERLCPRLARRIVLAGCGVAITTGLTVPAMADPAGLTDPWATVRRTDVGARSGLSGLAVPDRAEGASTIRAGDTQTVTVAAGDSLWVIAKRFLPRDASDHEITNAWHALLGANQHRIGADPDLILPGTHLKLPQIRPTGMTQQERHMPERHIGDDPW